MNHNSSGHDQKGVGGMGSGALGLAIAAALGAAVGIMFAPQSGQKTRKELAQKAEDLAATFKESRENIQSWLTEAYGSVSDQLEELYLNVQGNVLAAIEELDDKKQLTQKKYEGIVDDVLKKASEGMDWAEDKMKKWQDRFYKDYNKVKAQMK